jgi:hypothetical protein
MPQFLHSIELRINVQAANEDEAKIRLAQAIAAMEEHEGVEVQGVDFICATKE